MSEANELSSDVLNRVFDFYIQKSKLKDRNDDLKDDEDEIKKKRARK